MNELYHFVKKCLLTLNELGNINPSFSLLNSNSPSGATKHKFPKKPLFFILLFLFTGSIQSQCLLFDEPFTSSLGQFTAVGGSNGNWVFANSCTQSNATGHTATGSAMFQGSGCQFGNGGLTVSGSMNSPTIAVPGTGATASFNYYVQNECGTSGSCSYDVLYFEISNNGGTSFTTIASTASGGGLSLGGWHSYSYNLTSYLGQNIILRFRFNSIDGAGNAYDGVYVDDVEIEFSCPYANDAGLTEITSPAIPTCNLGTLTPVEITLQNFGTAALTNTTIEWWVNGVAQTPMNWTGNVPSLSTLSGVVIGSYTFSPYDTLKIKTSMPNGVNDSIPQNDSLQIVVAAGLAGNYSIGGTGADYASFTDAVNDLIQYGVCGPTFFNVTPNSGPFNEQISIPEIHNTSIINKIFFNGNGNTITFAPTTTQRHIIKLDGADFITFSDLVVEGTSNTFGYGFLITNNSENNLISNCTVDLTAAMGATWNESSGIVMSGSSINPTATGNSGSNNIITGSTIKGGYYGITMIGNSSTANTEFNYIGDCTIEDFYYGGIYLIHVSNSTFLNNQIKRPSRTSVTTFYGIYHGSSGSGNNIEGNRIYDAFGGLTTTTSLGTYGIWHDNVDASVGNENKVINNEISRIKSNGLIYSIYNSGSDHIQYYHNTISLDDTSATAGITRGFFQTTAASGIDFKNNLISIKRKGNGLKHCLYFATPTSAINSNYNILFTDSTQTTSNIGFYGSDSYRHLNNWKTANSNAYDQNSISLDPYFLNASIGLFYPTNWIMDNLGTPVGVFSDIDNTTRSSTTPDIGAYEITPPPFDVHIEGITTDLDPCFGANDSLRVLIINTGNNPLNFSTHTLTIDYTITGPVSTSGSFTLNSGTLGVKDTIIPALSPVNLSTPGLYHVTTTVSSTWDISPQNNYTERQFLVGQASIIASNDSICNGETVSLTVSGFQGNIQWQKDDGTGFINIPGAVSHTISDTISSNTLYRVSFCNTYSDTISIVDATPLPPVTTNDTVCLGDSATVTASSLSGQIKWYNSASGGTPLHTGNSFKTKVNSNTTFYAEASSGQGGSNSVGPVNPAAVSASGGGLASTYYMSFDVLIPTTLLSVDVFPTAPIGSNGTIVIQTNTGAAIATYPYTTTVTGGSTPQTVNLNLPMMPGTGYRMIQGVWIDLYRNFAGAVYPYTSTAINITGNSFDPTYYYHFYNWKFSSGCLSSRVPAEVIVNQPPAIAPLNNSAICDGNSVTLDAGPGAANYLWTPGLENTQSILVNSSGTYSITATGANGCSDSKTIQVMVHPLPQLTINANKNTLCKGESVTLSGSGALILNWNKNVNNNQSFKPDSTDTYTLTGTSIYGCTNTDSIEIVVNDLPQVDADVSSSTICEGDEVIFTGSGALNYDWNKGVSDGSPFIPLSSGYFSVIGTDGNGCIGSDSVFVTVNELPTVVANASKTEVCEGDSITLSGSGATSFSWTNNVDNGVAFPAMESGLFTVTGTDANNCENTDDIYITVNQLPQVSANASNEEVCKGEPVTLSGQGAETYLWDNGVENNVSFKPESTLNYTVTGTDINGCKNTFHISVIVNDPPVASLPEYELSCIDDGSFQLFGGEPAGGTYLHLGLSANEFNPGVAGLGVHNIDYIVTNDKGCSDTARSTITVDVCAGIEAGAFDGRFVNIYPNPSFGNFILEIGARESEEIEVILYNSNGKAVSKEKHLLLQGQNKINFNGSNYARGIYFMTIVTSERLIQQKIILN